MKKTILISTIIDSLYGNEFFGTAQNTQDITLAIRSMMIAAGNVYFLTVPNPNDRMWFDEAVDTVNVKMASIYDDAWYTIIYRMCITVLESMYSRWDMVQIHVTSYGIVFDNKGDYRIHLYHAQYGTGRISDEQPSAHVAPVDDVTDPFHVADTVSPELNEDAFNVTKRTLAAAFRSTPSYLQLE